MQHSLPYIDDQIRVSSRNEVYFKVLIAVRMARLFQKALHLCLITGNKIVGQLY
jgi:hypothetical protein